MKVKFLVIMTLLLAKSYATASAIIGGGDFTGIGPFYAAFVAPDGTLTQLTGGGLASGEIFTVAINTSGAAILGGTSNPSPFPAYVALVSPNGTVTQLSGGGLPTAEATIQKVAINTSGAGIIGGISGIMPNPQPAYAALVAPDGTLTQLSGGGFPSISGIINDVAINDSGVGIIGGEDSTGTLPAYAALVAPNGTLTQLSGGGFPSTHGEIVGVAINDSGAGIIGGEDSTGTQPAYAALVAPNGTLTQLSGGGFPSIQGIIEAVAINSSGAAIIGGSDETLVSAYAALVSPNGTLTQLSGGGIPLLGDILSVAINSSGAGIIGGIDFTGPAYAALVAPDGTLTQLSGGGFPSTSGEIFSVAIHSSGAGIIGGVDLTGTRPAYAALVAPNGTLTQLSGGGFPSIFGEINGVAIADLLGVTLQSIGPYSSVFNMQLAATFALETHLVMFDGRRVQRKRPNEEMALLASSSDALATLRLWKQEAPTSETEPNQEMENVPHHQEIEKDSNYVLWAAPFGDYVHQKEEQKIPTFTNEIAGMLIGFDYQRENWLTGLGLGYAFNYVHYGQSQGHAKINEEMACAYGLYSWEHCWINGVVWGGLYQLNNERHTLVPLAPRMTSTAHTQGWVFSPHLEVAAPFKWKDMNSFTLEPFCMFDWVNNWQDGFTEHGKSGFNLILKDHYASLLRSEVGLRFYELLHYNWGKLLFEEKASYVNLAPFHTSNATTLFVASASTFPIAIGSTRVQNLGGVEFRAAFLPWNQKMPYGVLCFQGEFGSSYQSYFANLELGENF